LYEPFYIGKGKCGRYREKFCGRNKYFKNKINKIKQSGLEPVIIKLYENLNEQQSFEKEIELIEEIGRIDLNTGTLVNMTNGGEGMIGYHHTEETLKEIRKDFQEIKKEFEKRDYKLVTEEKDYKNAQTKLKYICQSGHKDFITWGNFQQKHGCPYCKKVKVNFSEIKNEFERRKYKLLTEENEYKNDRQKLNYICPEGHTGYITWNNFKKGQNCSTCYNKSRSKKMIGKNSILIIQDVVQIKLLLKEGKLTQREIANIFNISSITISDIKRGKTWSNIKI